MKDQYYKCLLTYLQLSYLRSLILESFFWLIFTVSFCTDFSWLLCQTKDLMWEVFFWLWQFTTVVKASSFWGEGYSQMVPSSCHSKGKGRLTCFQIIQILLSVSLVLAQAAVDAWKEDLTLHRNSCQFFVKFQDFWRVGENPLWCLWNLSSSWESLIYC